MTVRQSPPISFGRQIPRVQLRNGTRSATSNIYSSTIPLLLYLRVLRSIHLLSICFRENYFNVIEASFDFSLQILHCSQALSFFPFKFKSSAMSSILLCNHLSKCPPPLIRINEIFEASMI